MLERLKEIMGSAVFWQTATFIVVTIGLIALAICDPHRSMEKQANYKAWCDSISGKFSGTTCFVEGVEMKMENEK